MHKQRRLSIKHNIGRFLLGIALVVSAASAKTADQLYTSAQKLYYELIGAGNVGEPSDYLACVEKFNQVVSDFPNSRRAPDAIYSQGLLYWNMHQRFGKIESLYNAIKAYERLESLYPQSSLVDDAIYNTAMIYDRDLGNRENAKSTLGRLVARYPNSDTTIKAKQYAKRYKFTLPTTLLAQEQNLPESSAPPTAKKTSRQNKVKDVRYWSNPEYTRVSIYLDHSAEFKHNMLKKDATKSTPYRLYIDVHGAQLTGSTKRSIDIENGILNRVRTGQYKPKVARVVLDMDSVHDYEVAYRDNPSRIVIDVQGKATLTTSSDVVAVEVKQEVPTVTKKQSIDSEGKVASKSYKPVMVQPIKKKMGSAAVPQRKDSPQLSDPGIEVGSIDVKRSNTVSTSKLSKARTIVIDPGHGGEDPGAKGPTGITEKEIVLSIALKLKDKLEAYPNIRTVMTRHRDVYIPLPKRSQIANEERGDLFVSIHANASPKRHASGISTYVFNNAKDDYSKRLEAIENASVISGKKNEPDFLTMMFRSMAKNFFTNQSVELAADVQNSMVNNIQQKYSRVRNLGVRQARFYVLWNTEMPSILVETSFISNPREEKRLRSKEYQSKLANSIATGIMSYMDKRFAAQDEPSIAYE